jgi:hypothetical protein
VWKILIECLLEGDAQLKAVRNIVTALVMILLSAPFVYGQDLSKYPNIFFWNEFSSSL